MRASRKTGIGFAIASLLGGAGVASADEPTTSRKVGDVAVMAAGGIEDFTSETMRDTSNVNGIWGIRADVVVDPFISIEGGYLGSAATVTSPLGSTEATLVGTAFEAIARVTPLRDSPVQPYAFAGAGWRHYEVTGEDFTTSASGMADSDDILQIPLGAGVGYHVGSLVADARFTFRAAASGESLVLEQDGDYAPLHTWGVTAGVGYSF